MTNSPDFKSCVMNNAVVSLSIVEVIFHGSVAYIVTFTVSTIFIAVCGLVQYMKSKECETLGQLSPLQVILKSGLPGFSFGSEMVLVIGILYERPNIALVMFIFRFLHIFATSFVLVCLFGPKKCLAHISRFIDPYLWKRSFNYDFAKLHLPLTGAIIILCLCDISLVQMLPWSNTRFFSASHGFPSKSMMRFALGVDILQAGVSVVCTIIYLTSAMSDRAKDPMTSSAALVVFALNIAFSLFTIIISFCFFS